MTDMTLTTTRPRLRLRTVLKLDAVITGANGAAYLAAAGPLADLLGFSEALLRGVGAFLLACAAVVWLIGTRKEIARGAVYVVVAANAMWAVDSVVVALAGWGDPTTTGTVWLLLQAAVVAVLAELQLAGARRMGR
jgi:hypothetical protein